MKKQSGLEYDGLMILIDRRSCPFVVKCGQKGERREIKLTPIVMNDLPESSALDLERLEPRAPCGADYRDIASITSAESNFP